MAVFVDTAFLLALVIENDALHHRAIGWRRAVAGRFITSDFVLLEVADSLSKPSRRPLARDIIDEVRADSSVEIVALDSSWLDRGLDLFHQSHDKEWGLTDCISFTIMRERGITEALTYDHHFEQAGFKALLRENPPAN